MSTTRTDNLLPLLESINQLQPAERAALSLLAVMYAPVARSPLAQCLQKAGIRSAGDRMMVPGEVMPLMARLVKVKLVVELRESYRCNPLLAHFLVRQAQHEGVFERYVKAVQEIIAPRHTYGAPYYRTFELCVQDIRIALYRGFHASLRNLLELCGTSFPRDFYQSHPLVLICGESLDTD